jgi:hypothetical protein
MLFKLRWGFLQFSTDAINATKFIETPNWPVYSSLVMLYDAEKACLVLCSKSNNSGAMV